ncbi:MAG: GH12 family glycosyl hydrolase domain-containing protein [Janthinobacterium lividum]
MRRAPRALLALTLLAPLLLLAEPAAASTARSASCTDGGGHAWKVRAVWGSVYSDHGGTRRVAVKSLKFTTKSRAVTHVGYTITVVEGTGRTVQTIRRDSRKVSFKSGKKYLSIDPRNPRSSPGRTKVVLKVGDARDGKGSCTVTFVQPGGSSSPTSSPTSSPAGGTCSPGHEVVKFKGGGSAGLAQYGQGNYDASSELWGVNGYHYAQTMGVCTHDAWYVDVKTDNSKGDGAVKAYPSLRRIYHDWSTSNFSRDPRVSSFPRLDVTFAAKDPATCPRCIYDTAFDIWLNGIGNGSSDELMIWTHNVNQTPYGKKVGSKIKIAGHTWDLYAGNANHYLAFVPTDTSNIPSGTFDVQDFTSYLAGHGTISKASTLGQISFGVETVSTNNVSRHWDFTRFSVRDS